jgi:phosphoribosyl 1,2-cyclic phosphodiesterase/DNA-binding response OmpR family regulator
MQVRFHGTRGSIAVPGPTTLRYGGNTACLEVRSAAGTLVVLDCGTGAFGLGQRLIAEAGSRGAPLRGHLLITHTHWDHIQGIPFFKPLFVPGFEWDVYAPRGLAGSLRETLCGQMQSAYFPVSLSDFGATVRYHELVEGEFDIGDVHVRTQYLNHPALTLGYRLEADRAALVYACDHEPYSRQLATGRGELSEPDRQHAAFLAEADLVIHDAQYTADEYPTRAGWGHSTPEYAVRLACSAGVKRLALTHHDPLRNDTAVDQIVERVQVSLQQEFSGSSLEIFAAAEGQTLDLNGVSARSQARAQSRPSAVAQVGPALVGQTVVLGIRHPTEAAELAEAIRADGVRVVAASDGQAILGAARAERPSLILLDREWADPDTLAQLHGLRRGGELGFDTQIVLIVSAEDQRHPGGGLGVTDWLERPFSTVYARARVRAWLLRTACRWMRAPVPPDEDRRLAAVERLRALQGEPEQRLNELTRRAAALFDVPVALVTLVDRETQWIKASCGLPELRQTSREVSFCAHLLCRHGPMIVPDTLLDDRFADNPVVSAAPRIRFYAGVPLTTEDGMCVGSLCLVDSRPRQLDDGELKLLTALGERVQQELYVASHGRVPDDSQVRT